MGRRSSHSGREYFCGYNHLNIQGLWLEIGRDEMITDKEGGC